MPKFLLQHDSTKPAGITMACKEDDKGLYFKGELNLEVREVKEYYSLIKQGALEGFSVGFVPRVWKDDENVDTRSFEEVDLMEISLVTFPANEAALITAVRNELPKDIREFEKFLREAGYSRTDAKRIAGHGFNKSNQDQRDVEGGEILKRLDNLINTINGK
jgi:HK97 family phage prohead protease